jgi:hypothetical protein
MIDFKGAKLINDVAGAQTSETEEGTMTGKIINNHQVKMVVGVAGDTTRSRVDDIAEKDLAWFSGGSNGGGATRGSADGGNCATDAERVGFRDNGYIVPDVGSLAARRDLATRGPRQLCKCSRPIRRRGLLGEQ